MKFVRALLLLTVLLYSLSAARAATYYVAQNNPNPVPPYNTWPTAATNIQDAIDVATNGDLVLVTNGTYAFGGLAMVGTMTNRVCLNLPLTVQSVAGPWVDHHLRLRRDERSQCRALCVAD